VNPLDLGRNVVLESVEFTIVTADLSLAHRWIYQTLQTITSPLFNEFVIWILGWGAPWSLVSDDAYDGWMAVDALLVALAKRNPDFRVAFRRHGSCSFIASYLPLVWSKGLVQFRCPRAENQFEKLGIV